MGFFRFLKKDKQQGNEAELDLPPAPPPIEGFEDDKDANFPEFPQISAPKDEDFKFDFSQDDKMPELGKEVELPDFPDLEDLDKGPSPSPQPDSMPNAQQYPRMMPVFNQAPMPRQEFNGPLIQPTVQTSPAAPLQANPKHRGPERIVRSGESMYVRVDRFKIVLDHINIIRSDLRKSDADLMKLEGLKHEKDKSFDKFRVSLDDLQKKLIFVDKTLFKG